MERERIYLSTIDTNAGHLARQYGLGLEIAEYCTANNMDDNFSKTDAMVKEKMKDLHRFILHGPFNELFPCAIDAKARELANFRFCQALNIAKYYGIKKIVLHGNYNPKIYYPEWYVEQSVCFWDEFVKHIPGDMVICLENVFEEKPEMLRDIIQSVGDKRLQMCLDVGHVNAYSTVAVIDWVKSCAEYIGHFHIHNNDGAWDTHSGLNEGTIPMEELLLYIEQFCPNSSITLEVIDVEQSLKWLTEKSIL